MSSWETIRAAYKHLYISVIFKFCIVDNTWLDDFSHSKKKWQNNFGLTYNHEKNKKRLENWMIDTYVWRQSIGRNDQLSLSLYIYFLTWTKWIKLVNQMIKYRDILDSRKKLLLRMSIDLMDTISFLWLDLMRCFKKIHIIAALFPLVFLVGIIIVCFAKTSWRKLAISFDFRCGSECTCALDICFSNNNKSKFS